MQRCISRFHNIWFVEEQKKTNRQLSLIAVIVIAIYQLGKHIAAYISIYEHISAYIYIYIYTYVATYYDSALLDPSIVLLAIDVGVVH